MPQMKTPLLKRIFNHVMSFGFCVGVPAAVMVAMPVVSTTFTRNEGVVSATAVQKIFFVIPIETETMKSVTSVDDYQVSGTLSKTTRSGPVNDPKRPETRSEDMSWLVIQGHADSIRVPVSPVNIDDVRRRVSDFLDDDSKSEMRLFTFASWKISIVIAGVLCLLALTYLGSIVVGVRPRAGAVAVAP